MSRPVALSIVIPTCGREVWLAELLEALRGQITEVPGSEILVVDNSAAGSAAACIGMGDVVRYVHEPRRGVAHARNRGVAAARGTHIVFIDDDELPAQGWLAAFDAAARAGCEAGFGPITPRFEDMPPATLRQPLERMFGRSVPAGDGADITAWRAHLGSGNSMFCRALLQSPGPPFDPRFNGGGEDVWLLRQLVDDRGIRLIWCAGALVAERVPSTRMTAGFVRQRRFRDGQLRCIVESGAGGLAALRRVGLWMLAGAGQFVVLGSLSLLVWPLDRARSFRLRLASVGGLGKLLWWRARDARTEA